MGLQQLHDLSHLVKERLIEYHTKYLKAFTKDGCRIKVELEAEEET